MIKPSIVTRFSTVLFNLDKATFLKEPSSCKISCSKDMEKRANDLEAIRLILHNNPQFHALLESPQINFDEKKEFFKEVLEKSNLDCKDDGRFIEFLYYLIERRRLPYLEHIALDYRRRVNEFLGLWEATLVTATPLEESVSSILKSKLEKSFRKKIKLNEEIDPKILGGAILLLDNQMIDWSLKGRLRRMKERILE